MLPTQYIGPKEEQVLLPQILYLHPLEKQLQVRMDLYHHVYLPYDTRLGTVCHREVKVKGSTFRPNCLVTAELINVNPARESTI